MANGSTRLAQSQMIIKNERAQSEQAELLALSKKGAKMPKLPLKAGKK